MSNPDDKGFFTGQADPDHPPSPVPRVSGGDGGGSSSAITPGGGAGTQSQRGKNRSLRDITAGGEEEEPAGSSTKPRTRRKPDPSAAKVTEPCSECGRRFWSQKALFGHMRCHPERQWRGVNPPPHLRRPQPPVDNLSLLPPPPPASPFPPPPQGGEGPLQDAEREVATCLVMLANGPTAGNAPGPTGEAGAMDVWPAPAAPPPSQVHVNFPSSGTTGATPPPAPSPSQVHVNFPPPGTTDAMPPVAPPPSQAHVNIPPSGAPDAIPPPAPTPSALQVHANCRFECSSCKKVFGSHQALGGHRASHKNVKGCFAMAKNEGEEASGVSGGGGGNNDPGEAGDDGRRPAREGPVLSVVGAEEHRCKVCNRAFSSGQALGGHLRGQCRGRGPHEPEALICSEPSSSDVVPDLNLPPPPENSGSSPSEPALDLKLGM